jgi:hypothetical protein
MKNLMTFSQYINESYNNESYELKQNDLSSIDSEILYESYFLLEEGWLKQTIGWTFLLPITLANTLRQLIMKKIKIKKMLKNETDPAKKKKLREELKGISYEEAKLKEKVEDQKLKMKDAANNAKANATPEEKEKYKKEKAKMQKKLDKANAELRKVQGEFNGIV